MASAVPLAIIQLQRGPVLSFPIRFADNVREDAAQRDGVSFSRSSSLSVKCVARSRNLIFEAVERMPGDVNAEHFLLAGKLLFHRPVRQLAPSAVLFSASSDRTCRTVRAGPSRGRASARSPDSIARSSASVNCARFAPVESNAPALIRLSMTRRLTLRQVDAFAEIVDGCRTVRPLTRARNDGFYCALTDILHGAQPEPDRFAGGREVQIALIDVGRKHRNAHLPALVDVLHDLVHVARLRGEQGRHELDRVVRLQIRRDVGEIGVGGGMRLVEAVAGELLHQIEDLGDLLGREAALRWRR